MRDPLHHLHRRKRVTQQFEQYPSPQYGIRFLDRLLIVVAVVAPMTMLPQIIKLYATRDVASFSLTSWALFCVFNLLWLVYGIVHKDKPILISNALWFITQAAIVVAIIIYR